jgi:DNA repair protein RecN (Recombination protein N)
MLAHLSVQNYAIIEQLEIDFSSSLNVITGETGAGKSILVGALALILGERADSSVLLNREKKCIVEGVFRNAANDRLRSFLLAEELDVHDEVVVRREIAPNGKSRAFINDTPVNLSQLTGLSSMLVDMHQQFDTLELGDTGFQREVVDALAGNAKKLDEYRSVYNTLTLAKNRHSELLEQKNQFNKEFDYQQFQFTELSEAGFKENELEDMEQELKLQQNAEGIKNALAEATYALQDADDAIIRKLKVLIGKLETFSGIQPGLQTLVERLNGAQIELKDVAGELESISDHVNADPGTIEKLNDRLSEGYRLLKKHGLRTTSELLQLQKELEIKLESVLNIDDRIAEEEKAMAALLAKADDLAAQLSKARHSVVGDLEKQVNEMLVKVGMPNARLRVSITGAPLDANGCDNIDFLFNANIPASAKAGDNKNFQPVRKVASGGELSRLMLCIKSLVARSMDLPSMIFDEIDTGISGEAARQVAAIMKDLAAARQIICITHQPQIAGKATAHFLVFKSVEGNAVKTAVRLLGKEERIVAIAKMLSGEKPTAAAMENAREMVMN